MRTVMMALIIYIFCGQILIPRFDFLGIGQGADLQKFTMKMEYPRTTRAFVQIINVLGDNLNLEIIFQFNQVFMSCIGSYLKELPASLIVKIMDQIGVAYESFRCGYIIHIVTFPQSVGIPECFDPTFCTHPCASEYHEFLFHFTKLEN